MIYDKWNPPSENGRYVDYDTYEELTGKYLKTQVVLKQIFELLEEHQPTWYLRKHYNDIKAVLE